MFVMLVARFLKESNEKKINSTLIIRIISKKAFNGLNCLICDLQWRTSNSSLHSLQAKPAPSRAKKNFLDEILLTVKSDYHRLRLHYQILVSQF
jgi:hypothetical protein